ncbi:MAG: hypothetical protein IJV98_04530 [Clostridia bacterium]|nr:hypothetical protein [Clostridia bacterium]
MKVVFLDYDGVVNRRMWETVGGTWVCRYGYPEDGAVNDRQAVQWVSEFCEKQGYHIVVTSTWRKYPGWDDCLRAAGLRESVRILGATGEKRASRGEEIDEYLRCRPEITRYLIFDDRDDLGVHRKYLVKCDPAYGFGEKEYEKAIWLDSDLR